MHPDGEDEFYECDPGSMAEDMSDQHSESVEPNEGEVNIEDDEVIIARSVETPRSDIDEKIQRLKNDPQYEDILKQLVGENVRDRSKSRSNCQSETSSKHHRNRSRSHEKQDNRRERGELQQKDDYESPPLQVTPVNNRVINTMDLEQRRTGTEAGNFNSGNRLIKSLSDTTIYAPALRKGFEHNDALNQISNFVENIRLEQSGSPGQHSQRDN